MNIKKNIISLIAILTVSQTALAVEPASTPTVKPQQTLNINIDDKFISFLTFESLSNSINNIKKNIDVVDGFQKAISRYTQTNVVAAYKDFSNIVNSLEHKNDFMYITIARRLSNLGFFTLSQNALINVEDNDLWYITKDSIKKMYTPEVTLTYDEEIYLAQLHTATLYNNSAKETIKTLEDNSSILKKSDYANYVLAVAYFENKNYTKAMNYITKAIEKAPNCINYLIFKEKIYTRLGNYKNALKIIKEIETSDLKNNYSNDVILADKYYILMKMSNNDKAKYYSAKLLFIKGDNKKAISEAQSAISQNKKNLEAYILIGDNYIRSKNPEKAKEYYQKALAIQKKYAPALMGMGHYYYVKKDYSKSLEYYQNAYKYENQDEQLLLCLANNYIMLNNNDESMVYLKKVLKLNQSSDGAYYLMSKLVPDMQEAYLRKAISLNMVNTHAWIDLAELKIQQKNYKKAEEYLFPISVLEPQNSKYHYLKEQLNNKNSSSISTNNKIMNDNSYQLFFQ